ncbi:hypothetical protein BTN49_1993 [Candidatus Enterovibrio escicola]|uniref:Uncharacterized protein n=2 Tax=Candidatus Enterovibrio escicola TaxID=1927127 RepID=A0A2A5T2N5_9GAMM|nr:hypothetical protein BTN49_1993 [Candidatus Enterovibrio escacola]
METFIGIMSSSFYDSKTLTSDNGTESIKHEEVVEIYGADFYFARPY